MIIGIDWVIVLDLVSLIGGVVMGIFLVRPTRDLGRRNDGTNTSGRYRAWEEDVR